MPVPPCQACGWIRLSLPLRKPSVKPEKIPQEVTPKPERLAGQRASITREEKTPSPQHESQVCSLLPCLRCHPIVFVGAMVSGPRLRESAFLSQQPGRKGLLFLRPTLTLTSGLWAPADGAKRSSLWPARTSLISLANWRKFQAVLPC